MISFDLVIPSFIAGVLTFLAPCTLPLVPGFLSFISGVTATELQNVETKHLARRKIFLNACMYVIGFSIIFILLGSLFGLGGVAFAKYRVLTSRIGGVFVIIFGLYMMRVLQFKWFSFMSSDVHLPFTQSIQPGKPLSSLLFGSIFAFGWTPCVGPILGSVLILASATTTVAQGATLLFIFSLGLAVPFLLIALLYGSAARYIGFLTTHSGKISFVGGLFLVLIGVLLVTDSFNYWSAYLTRLLNLNFEQQLLKYL